MLSRGGEMTMAAHVHLSISTWPCCRRCFSRQTAPSPSVLNTLPPSCHWEHSYNQTATVRCLTVGDKALQTSAQFCVHMRTGVCVCVLRPKGPLSGRMYEHARPAGVNKQLISYSLLQAEEQPIEEPCYLTSDLFSFPSLSHGNLLK